MASYSEKFPYMRLGLGALGGASVEAWGRSVRLRGWLSRLPARRAAAAAGLRSAQSAVRHEWQRANFNGRGVPTVAVGHTQLCMTDPHPTDGGRMVTPVVTETDTRTVRVPSLTLSADVLTVDAVARHAEAVSRASEDIAVWVSVGYTVSAVIPARVATFVYLTRTVPA